MTELWLVRHGQTDWNVEGRYQGQADQPLNDVGFAQARALARELDGRHFDALYSSDLLRARQTAATIAQQLGLQVTVDRRLREINQGEWEGQLFTDIVRRYEDEIAARREDPVGSRPPGGESVAEVASRIWTAVDEIVLAHPGGRVLLVSHGLALATLMARARGASLAEVYSLIPDNASPQVITWEVDGTVAVKEEG